MECDCLSTRPSQVLSGPGWDEPPPTCTLRLCTLCVLSTPESFLLLAFALFPGSTGTSQPPPAMLLFCFCPLAEVLSLLGVTQDTPSRKQFLAVQARLSLLLQTLREMSSFSA